MDPGRGEAVAANLSVRGTSSWCISSSQAEIALRPKLAGTSWKEATWQDMVVERRPKNRFTAKNLPAKG